MTSKMTGAPAVDVGVALLRRAGCRSVSGATDAFSRRPLPRDSRLSARDNRGRGCLRQSLRRRGKGRDRLLELARGGFPNRRLGLELSIGVED